jgi:predicted nucleotidyltransferase
LGTQLTGITDTDLNREGGREPDEQRPSGRPAVPYVPIIPWLDPATAAGVVDIVQSLAVDHPEALAVILFGSVARREERPLDDREPSDVDLLLLLDVDAVHPGAYRLSYEEELALHRTIIEADYRQQSPREIKVLFVYRDLERWDDLFLENVAHDGILLWARCPLPAPLAAIAERDPSRALAAAST